MTRARRPAALAYYAVRDAPGLPEAKQVYDAAKASGCFRRDACQLAGDCPFVVDCLIAEGDDDGT